MNATPVTFIGLGAMGTPMARNLMTSGFSVTVFNRSPAPADRLAIEGARVASSSAASVNPGGIVVTMLANDQALEDVVLGESGILGPLGAGGLHISMSTVSPETSRRLAAAHTERGSLFLAAPVFGRPEAAAARKLWICQSGSKAAKARAQEILTAVGQGIHDFGEDPGAANVVKLSGNFLILSAIEAMAEALALAEKNGIDRMAVANLLGETIFACPIYQNYGRMLATRSYGPAGFKLSLGMKDVRLVRDVAEAATLPMPLSDLLHARLLGSLAKGRENLDWTAIELASSEDGGIMG